MTDEAGARLLGRWRLHRAEGSLDFAPDASLEFLPGGRLRYTFTVDGAESSIMLVYRVDGDLLLTDNPAAPHARSTGFSFGAGDVLALDFTEARAWFVRELPTRPRGSTP